ncbi:hypothetical protein T459_01569 [Capsicum annuum]|uniref:Lumazine-binding domain-containing protein n=1 Tax=Capsicum annuum TaxID=4072 RepID=A0A2G3AHH9_CAPAN|nr:hypothetical protein T459_01569 [Capsicum annuum]
MQKGQHRTNNQQRCICSTSITSMFICTIKEMGRINQLGYDKPDSFIMKIQAKIILEDINLGDSISVNGTCLTVDHFDKGKLGFKLSGCQFIVGLIPEMLRKTSLIESLVNLERDLKPSTRMGGHFVHGYVDGSLKLKRILYEEGKRLGEYICIYIVAKGFMVVNRNSLTVVDVFDELRNGVYTAESCDSDEESGTKGLGKFVERFLITGFVDSINSSLKKLFSLCFILS